MGGASIIASVMECLGQRQELSADLPGPSPCLSMRATASSSHWNICSLPRELSLSVSLYAFYDLFVPVSFGSSGEREDERYFAAKVVHWKLASRVVCLSI